MTDFCLVACALAFRFAGSGYEEASPFVIGVVPSYDLRRPPPALAGASFVSGRDGTFCSGSRGSIRQAKRPSQQSTVPFAAELSLFDEDVATDLFHFQHSKHVRHAVHVAAARNGSHHGRLPAEPGLCGPGEDG